MRDGLPRQSPAPVDCWLALMRRRLCHTHSPQEPSTLCPPRCSLPNRCPPLVAIGCWPAGSIRARALSAPASKPTDLHHRSPCAPPPPPPQVGHNALGAGQLIDQGAALVDKALASGSIFEGEGWKYISPAFEANTLHFIGLLSDGGVHSRTDQLYGCIRGAAERGAKRIR